VDVARWTYQQLNAVLPAVARLERAERTTLVRRALVLHTDIAIAFRRPTGYDLPPHGRPSMVFSDGRLLAEGAATYHWDFARALITRLPRGPERVDTARTFYRAIGALMQSWSAHPELDAHLAAGERELGPDSVLLLYQGTRQQVFAHPRARAAFDEWRRQTEARLGRGRSTGMLVRDQRSIASLRLEAEKAFRAALELDGSLHEARIRLAHILLDRGRHLEALEQVAATGGTSLSPMLGFYLNLVKGRAERALARLDDARASFEAARVIVPHAQAPLVALSEVALALGDRATAGAYLEALASGSTSDEPWAMLARTHDGTEEMMRALRAGF
jgi:hypothetical protein